MTLAHTHALLNVVLRKSLLKDAREISTKQIHFQQNLARKLLGNRSFFTELFFGEVYLENSYEIPAKLAKICKI